MENSPTKEKPITISDQILKITLSSQDKFTFSYHQSIEEIKEIIDNLGSQDLFFETPFHQALEEFPPTGMCFRYVILWINNLPAAFLYFQLKKINLRESLDGSYQGKENSLTIRIKKFFTGLLNFHTLVNGNMLQTGRYGQYLPAKVDRLLTFDYYQSILDYVIVQLKNEKLRPVAILLKDYYLHEKISNEDCLKYGYSEFSVQPSMRLDIAQNWDSTEDYMSDLKSKYKVRTRRTLKKLNGVFRKELQLDDLEKYKETMHKLYKTIANQASFNLFILDPLYFFGLKKHLKDNIRIIGYFLDEKMVGFYTIVYNYSTLDAHFLGYDSTYNREYHLYHNMLYDLLFEAIDKKKKHLDLSRTAMEIKSSIGAKPSKMFLYLKVTNKIANKFTAYFLRFLTPDALWEERNPFK